MLSSCPSHSVRLLACLLACAALWPSSCPILSWPPLGFGACSPNPTTSLGAQPNAMLPFFLLVATAGRTTGSDNDAKLRAREDEHGADVFIAMLLLGLARGSFAFLVCPVGGRVLARTGDWLPSSRRSVYLHWQTARRFLPCAVKITSPPSCLDLFAHLFLRSCPLFNHFFAYAESSLHSFSGIRTYALSYLCLSFPIYSPAKRRCSLRCVSETVRSSSVSVSPSISSQTATTS